jgi:hypothetical protein
MIIKIYLNNWLEKKTEKYMMIEKENILLV